jgi:hypothetical protein
MRKHKEALVFQDNPFEKLFLLYITKSEKYEYLKRNRIPQKSAPPI